MTNDAKLGMLVGVLGVVVAAVLFAQPVPPAASELPKPAATAAVPVSTPSAVAAPAAVIAAELPREAPVLASTPVVRTRKEPVAVTASRQPDAEEP